MSQHEAELRPAEPTDAFAIHRLHTRSVQILCRSHYTPEEIAAWIGQRQPAGYLPAIERGEMFMATLAGQLVGFSHAVPGEIMALFVDPDWAGRGVGRQLLTHALTLAQGEEGRPVLLEATLNARTFYERCGFQRVEEKTVQRGQTELAVIVMIYPGEAR
jgi:GNAT superfamily N-acetyltransferase